MELFYDHDIDLEAADVFKCKGSLHHRLLLVYTVNTMYRLSYSFGNNLRFDNSFFRSVWGYLHRQTSPGHNSSNSQPPIPSGQQAL